MSDCIFCKIVNGEVPTEKVKESPNVVAFYDNDPSSETHILVTSKKHVNTFIDLDKEDIRRLLPEMFEMAHELIKEKKIENKYKLIINGGEHPHVLHLHLHILGGEIKRIV